MEKLRIIVGGFLGLLPAGGVTWDYLQYPLGLTLMGHDVFYLEDTRLYPIYQKPGSNWNDSSSCIEHLQKLMEQFGFSDRWAYRDEASGLTYGMSEKQFNNICSTADVFINISCSTVMRDEYAVIPARVLIDSDPMFTQIQYATQQSFTPGQSKLKQLVDAHNYHFSFGENINDVDCKIPHCGISWHPTRQPVCLSYWKPVNAFRVPASFTTVMNWNAGKILEYRGEEWGQKDKEFQEIMSLPKQVPIALSIVMNQTTKEEKNSPTALLENNGWQVLNPEIAAGNWESYREFISQSYAEFSVAKQTYVKANTGWFSCRSACYLAAGKPVVTQDTGWSKNIPSGEGLFAFKDISSAKEAITEVIGNYRKHCIAAREIAASYFDSSIVLKKLLEGLSGAQSTIPVIENTIAQ